MVGNVGWYGPGKGRGFMGGWCWYHLGRGGGQYWYGPGKGRTSWVGVLVSPGGGGASRAGAWGMLMGVGGVHVGTRAGHHIPAPTTCSAQIYADPSKRLELYFRPRDPYCHPACANRFPTSTMLLKVTRRRRLPQAPEAGEAPEPPEATFEMQILGVVTTVYKFQGSRLLRRLDLRFPAGRSQHPACHKPRRSR